MQTIRIFLKLCELNLKKLLIYRASFWISLVLMSMWVLAYIALIEVIFYHTNTLAGWNKGSVVLIMSFYYFVQNLSDIFYKESFEHFGENMRRGELDCKLVKPASARLLSFFWEIRFDHAASLIPTSMLFWYAFQNLAEPVSLPHLGLGFALSIVSLILYYSILSLVATLTFWVERSETFNALIFNISQLSRYPRQIYQNIIGKLLTFGIPLALIASVPAEAVVQFQNHLIPFFLFATVVFYVLSRVFWNVGLKKYTSAS